MAACDVLIMPWNRSEWVAASNPVKLKAFLAVGLPIISTPFPELARFRGLVSVADEPEAFANAIIESMSAPSVRDQQRQRVEGESWQSKSAAVMRQLSALSITPAGRAISRNNSTKMMLEPDKLPTKNEMHGKDTDKIADAESRAIHS